MTCATFHLVFSRPQRKIAAQTLAKTSLRPLHTRHRVEGAEPMQVSDSPSVIARDRSTSTVIRIRAINENCVMVRSGINNRSAFYFPKLFSTESP